MPLLCHWGYLEWRVGLSPHENKSTSAALNVAAVALLWRCLGGAACYLARAAIRRHSYLFSGRAQGCGTSISCVP